MMQIILPLTVGFLLLGIVLYWFLERETTHQVDLSEARRALSRLQSKFLPMSLVDRILDYNDFVFVRNQKDPAVLHLLENERKTIVIYWIRHTRQQVKLLMTFYVKSARRNARLAAGLEFQLALNYFVFLMACDALLSLTWLRGPFYGLKVARRTIIVVTRFCTVAENIVRTAEARHPNMQEAPGHQWPAGG